MHEIYVGFVDRTSDGEAIEVEKLPMACVCVCVCVFLPYSTNARAQLLNRDWSAPLNIRQCFVLPQRLASLFQVNFRGNH